MVFWINSFGTIIKEYFIIINYIKTNFSDEAFGLSTSAAP